MCGSQAVVSNLSMHQNHLEGLFKYSTSNLLGIGLGLIFFTFSNLSSDSDVVDPGTTL